MKPLYLFICEGDRFLEGEDYLRLEFEDREHILYNGKRGDEPNGHACGLEPAMVCINRQIEFDQFRYLLTRLRSRFPLAEGYTTSCFKVWATRKEIHIADKVFPHWDYDLEELRIAYEDLWDALDNT